MRRERVFLYDYGNDAWAEVADDERVPCIAEHLPLIFADIRPGFSSDRRKWKQWAWCAAHHRKEEIALMDLKRVTTKDGCRLEGVVAALAQWNYVGGGQGLIVRWRVSMQNDTVAMTADIILKGKKYWQE